jgi:hypothetical protein
MTTVYKTIPGGGFSSMPAESPVVLKRLMAQGWSETPPAVRADEAPPGPAAPVQPAPGVVEDAAPAVRADEALRRGRGRPRTVAVK